MTVETTSSKVTYSGNGNATAHSAPFVFLEDNHLRVVLVDSSGAEIPQTLSTDYTVSGAGDPNGGVVTMSDAPAFGETLIIRRVVPLTQSSDLEEGTKFPTSTLETMADRNTMMAQQIGEEVGRSLRAPVSETTIGDLPTVAARANKALGFDANGNPTVVPLTAGNAATDVSAFMATVIATETARAASALLGLGFDAVDRIAAFSVAAVDRGRVFRCNGTFTAALATAEALGDGFWCMIANDGTGTIAVAPDEAETIDGARHKSISANTAVLVVCDGTDFVTLGGSSRTLPPGAVFAFAGPAAPDGALKANGAAAPRAAYADLDRAIWVGAGLNAAAPWGYRASTATDPGNNRDTGGDYIVLPDLRGEFLRGWDDGRGVDAARPFGSAQAHAFERHAHTIQISSAAAGRGDNRSWGYTHPNAHFNSGTLTTAYRYSSLPNRNTADETRPRNVALLYCIAY